MEKIKAFNQKQIDLKNASAPPVPDSEKSKADKIKEKAALKEAADLAKEEEERRLREEQARLDAMDQMQSSISTIIDKVNMTVSPAKSWISALPTPGGLAALVIAIIVFALAVIPVDQQGHTRLYLFYQSLLGRTHMKYQETSTPGSVSYGGSAGTSFGSTPQSNGSGAGLPAIDTRFLNLFGTD